MVNITTCDDYKHFSLHHLMSTQVYCLWLKNHKYTFLIHSKILILANCIWQDVCYVQNQSLLNLIFNSRCIKQPSNLYFVCAKICLYEKWLQNLITWVLALLRHNLRMCSWGMTATSYTMNLNYHDCYQYVKDLFWVQWTVNYNKKAGLLFKFQIYAARAFLMQNEDGIIGL